MTVQTDTLKLELSTPDRAPVSLEAREITIPGAKGVFTVLPNHTPYLATLSVGVMIVRGTDGSENFFAINRGFAEVVQNQILILTQTAEREEEVDVERAEKAKERAEERLQKRDADIDHMRAEFALRRAVSRIRAHQRDAY